MAAVVALLRVFYCASLSFPLIRSSECSTSVSKSLVRLVYKPLGLIYTINLLGKKNKQSNTALKTQHKLTSKNRTAVAQAFVKGMSCAPLTRRKREKIRRTETQVSSIIYT